MLLYSSPQSADSSAPFFLYTPTSLLLNHALITDVHQITGKNGQQWIKCTRGRAMRSVAIYSAVDRATISSSLNTATIGPERSPSNGLYYCSAGESQKNYVSLFLNKISNSSKCITYNFYHTTVYKLCKTNNTCTVEKISLTSNMQLLTNTQ